MSFNPYRVFKFAATYTLSQDLLESQEFQSLSGFQVRCNLLLLENGSLCGVPVSIPIGFSSSLQLPFCRCLRLWLRRFQSLSGFQVRCNIAERRSGNPRNRKFQSLSGFQVRCNVLCCWQESTLCGVSIPIGFSSSLQQKFQHFLYSINKVSIPIGFSSSLQRSSDSFSPVLT